MLVLASCTAVAGIGAGTCGHQTGFPVCMQHAFSCQLTVFMALCRDLLDSWFQSTMAPAFNGMSQPNKYSTGGTLPGGASLELQSPALPGTGGSCGTDSRAVQALQQVGGVQLPEHGAAAAGGVQYPVKVEPADAEEPAMGAAAGAWGKSFKVPPLDLRDGAKRPRTSGARPTLQCFFIKQCPDSSNPRLCCDPVLLTLCFHILVGASNGISCRAGTAVAPQPSRLPCLTVALVLLF